MNWEITKRDFINDIKCQGDIGEVRNGGQAINGVNLRLFLHHQLVLWWEERHHGVEDLWGRFGAMLCHLLWGHSVVGGGNGGNTRCCRDMGSWLLLCGLLFLQSKWIVPKRCAMVIWWCLINCGVRECWYDIEYGAVEEEEGGKKAKCVVERTWGGGNDGYRCLCGVVVTGRDLYWLSWAWWHGHGRTREETARHEFNEKNRPDLIGRRSKRG